jgi:hypothetical protein
MSYAFYCFQRMGCDLQQNVRTMLICEGITMCLIFKEWFFTVHNTAQQS